MYILSIGNSFSQDAQKNLYELAKKEGVDITSANLYIGGCPLRMHYLCALNDYRKYTFEFNGMNTNLNVSIREALESREWDYVTVQQASPLSGKEDTYFPYLEFIVEYVKKYCPHAKILVHQTWAYEEGAEKALTRAGFETPDQMYDAVFKAYKLATKKIKADGVIPCGTVMYNLAKKGLKMHRDGKHASLGVGRYALALTWYKMLTGNNVIGNDYNGMEEAITEEERKIILEEVNKL